MNMKTLRQRCEQLLNEIDLPDPFTVPAFAATISHRRGRPLRLLAKSSPLGPCGLWIALPDADVVFYEAATSPLHRDHIIVHELAHLLAAHEPTETPDAELLRDLLPRLDPAVVRHVLARTTYSAVEEQEAEILASLVLQRANHEATTRPATTSNTANSTASSTAGGAASGATRAEAQAGKDERSCGDAGAIRQLNSTFGGPG